MQYLGFRIYIGHLVSLLSLTNLRLT